MFINVGINNVLTFSWINVFNLSAEILVFECLTWIRTAIEIAFIRIMYGIFKQNKTNNADLIPGTKKK